MLSLHDRGEDSKVFQRSTLQGEFHLCRGNPTTRKRSLSGSASPCELDSSNTEMIIDSRECRGRLSVITESSLFFH
ncbi:hypothetical protein KR51_00020670 [Rubidibacter lacunae KORDI 51-2]|uniref:Uncharacterized protein n=1 Tax=Rubidibacter lacunae KORDI 51-2 TaxID=582515 RepID=U5DP56_9CHRO|nr:hypothetical protein KR51_00020670 [Rubidibacter lacunae KORDI 51-2]